MRQRYEADQAALRALRMGLRDVTLRLLGDRRWRDFAMPGVLFALPRVFILPQSNQNFLRYNCLIRPSVLSKG
jgi:hypothetical protein